MFAAFRKKIKAREVFLPHLFFLRRDHLFNHNTSLIGGMLIPKSGAKVGIKKGNILPAVGRMFRIKMLLCARWVSADIYI